MEVELSGLEVGCSLSLLVLFSAVFASALDLVLVPFGMFDRLD